MKRNLLLSLVLLSGIAVSAVAVTPTASAPVVSKTALKVPKFESSVVPVMVEREDLIQSMPNAIVYAQGESRVNPELAPILSWNASYITAFPDAKIKIVGNATDYKDAEKNRKLALERAENVRTILFTMGVPFENTDIVSLGDTKPLFKKDSSGGFERNNRVDIFYTQHKPTGYYVDKIPVVKTDEFEQATIPMPMQ